MTDTNAASHVDLPPLPSSTHADRPSYFRMYSHLWHFAKGARVRLACASALLIASQLVKLCVPFLAGQAINMIQAGGPNMLADAGHYIALLLGAFTLSWALHGPGRVLERSVGVHVRGRLADTLYARVIRLPLAWHNRHHSGEVLHRVHQASSGLYDFAQNQFVYLQNLVNIVGPLVALMLLSKTLGGLAMLGFLVVGVVIIRFDRTLMRLNARENAADRRYAAGLLDFLGNISTVMSLRLHGATRRMLRERLAAVFEPLKRAIVVTELKWCAVDLLTIGLTWSLVAYYASQAHAAVSGLLLGSVFMVYQYAQQSGGVLVSLAAHFQGFSRHVTNYMSADPIWTAEPAPNTALAQPVREDWEEIAAMGLEFDYVRTEGTRAALRGASLMLRRGERIALVGSSGSGKSSFLRVLAGLYQPSRGHYLVDGVAQLNLRDLSAISTLIPQEYEVFEATLRENLTFGVHYAPADIDRALRVSGFDDVVTLLPQGLDTPLSERGFNLSGGQRQRLALARGLLAAGARPVLLLDEPTSALDQATENQVYDRLGDAWADGCVVASVHRMSLLGKFDRVVYMADGKVIDSGSVGDLLERQPGFAELLKHGIANQKDEADRLRSA